MPHKETQAILRSCLSEYVFLDQTSWRRKTIKDPEV